MPTLCPTIAEWLASDPMEINIFRSVRNSLSSDLVYKSEKAIPGPAGQRDRISEFKFWGRLLKEACECLAL